MSKNNRLSGLKSNFSYGYWKETCEITYLFLLFSNFYAPSNQLSLSSTRWNNYRYLYSKLEIFLLFANNVEQWSNSFFFLYNDYQTAYLRLIFLFILSPNLQYFYCLLTIWNSDLTHFFSLWCLSNSVFTPHIFFILSQKEETLFKSKTLFKVKITLKDTIFCSEIILNKCYWKLSFQTSWKYLSKHMHRSTLCEKNTYYGSFFI